MPHASHQHEIDRTTELINRSVAKKGSVVYCYRCKHCDYVQFSLYGGNYIKDYKWASLNDAVKEFGAEYNLRQSTQNQLIETLELLLP